MFPKVIQILIALSAVFTISTMAMDIWSLYLENHPSVLINWINNVNRVILEPTSKIAIAAHLFVGCIQAVALVSLFRSTSKGKFSAFQSSFEINFYLLGAEYGIFFAYLVLTWNHYLYLFITLVFISLAYKTILCWPLYEFQQSLAMPELEYVIVGETYTGNISMYHTSARADFD